MKSFVPKVVKFSQAITPFGGISYIDFQFDNCELSQLIDHESGVRGNGTSYSHGEIFRAWSNVFFCGGECAEDIQVHLRDTLKQISGNAVPGPDTMLREIKSLAAKNTEMVSSSGKAYQFNIIHEIPRTTWQHVEINFFLWNKICFFRMNFSVFVHILS